MAVLRIQTGTRRGTVIPIKETSIAIGRGDEVEVKIADKGVSRRHAEIFHLGELHFIRDLASRNGTYVNDRPIKEVVLRAGDLIRIGDSTLVFLEHEDFRQSRVMSFQEEGLTRDTIHLRETLSGFSANRLAAAKEDPRQDLPRRVAEVIAGGEDLQATLEKVVEEVGKALGADRADILILEEGAADATAGSGRRFRSVATFDTKGEGEVTVSRTILSKAAETQEAILSSDASSDERFDQARSVALGPLRSVLSIPLLAGGATAAVLYVSNSHHANAFGAADLEVAVQVGLQLSGLLGVLKRSQARQETLEKALLAALRAPRPAEGWDAERAVVVARHARGIALALELTPEDVTSVWVAAMLDGLGSGKGGGGQGDVIAGIPGLEAVSETIARQDERYESQPAGDHKTAKLSPLPGRILSLAKELDRLTREGGPQGSPLSLDEALQALRAASGTKFDPDVVRACFVAHRNGFLAAEGNVGLLP